MTFYPFPERLSHITKNITRGNFGLWFNKFIPWNNADALDPSDGEGDKTRAVEHYLERYRIMGQPAGEALRRKHNALNDFLESFSPAEYDIVIMEATLTSRLITGIGESHPREVGMVFDHNLGVPYIPASGIKGIVRFAHTLCIWREGVPDTFMDRDKNCDNIAYFRDDEYAPVYSLFGNQKNRGKVIFMDAYPRDVPELSIDIMNPHFSDYYSDEKKQTPPADYLKPNPIKFLTVAPGTTFIFRAVAKREGDMPEKVRLAFRKALTEEGVGAKTAVGYGRFELDDMIQQEWEPR